MKLICIKTNIDNTPFGDYSDYITLGKMYISDLDIIEDDSRHYQIYDDNGNKYYVPKELLITLEDWRDRQIKNLLK